VLIGFIVALHLFPSHVLICIKMATLRATQQSQVAMAVVMLILSVISSVTHANEAVASNLCVFTQGQYSSYHDTLSCFESIAFQPLIAYQVRGNCSWPWSTRVQHHSSNRSALLHLRLLDC
jgi:hypothetical protein